MQKALEGMKNDCFQSEKSRQLLLNQQFPGMTIEGKFFETPEEAAEAISKNIASYGAVEEREIGSYCGLSLFVLSEKFQSQLRLQGSISYNRHYYRSPLRNIESLNDIILNEIPAQIDVLQKEIVSTAQTYEQTKILVAEPFSRENELNQKTNRLREVTELLKKGELEQPAEQISLEPENQKTYQYYQQNSTRSLETEIGYESDCFDR